MFRWGDFLELADELAARQDDEAGLRTAISRAYYAAFHSGRAFLTRSALAIDRSGKTHHQVREELGSRDDQARQNLVRLHRWRKQADYDDVCTFDVAAIAPEAVGLARETIQRISALS